MPTHPIIAEDIRGVLSRTQSLWPDLKGASVFITGGTGFFGIWLLETLLAANREFSLGLRIPALSRDSAEEAEISDDELLRVVALDVSRATVDL
jgi:nucleoside-diphosphate-sugar epimerase